MRIKADGVAVVADGAAVADDDSDDDKRAMVMTMISLADNVVVLAVKTLWTQWGQRILQ